MSNNNNNKPPSPPQNPIPNAEINRNPAQGRIGPFINLPHRQGEPVNLGKLQAGFSLDRLRNAMESDGSGGSGGNNNSNNGGGNEGGQHDVNYNPTAVPTSSGIDTTGKKVGAGGKGTGNAEKEDDEDDEDADHDFDPIIEDDDDKDSDFELLEKPVYTPPESPDEVYSTTEVLSHKLPPELVPDIIEYAEYFPHKVIGSREEEESAGWSNDRKLYLTARIPEFDAFEKDTAGKGGDESKGGRPGRVRKLIFRLKSKDQGWSSYPNIHGTFIGAYSWIEVELWRKSLPLPVESKGKEKEDSDGEPQYQKIDGPHLIQRNKHASREFQDYEVVWDYKEDELPDTDPEKWEPDTEECWVRGGKSRNGKFVRELKGGDELRIYICSQYPGWSCRIKKAEVECIWAA